jgi:hypothetical protein
MYLREWIDKCAGDTAHEFADIVSRHGHLEVVKEFSTVDEKSFQKFPQTHQLYRNVSRWVLLSDGSAVGWNESPRNGWNFPRLGKKTVAKEFKAAA